MEPLSRFPRKQCAPKHLGSVETEPTHVLPGGPPRSPVQQRQMDAREKVDRKISGYLLLSGFVFPHTPSQILAGNKGLGGIACHLNVQNFLYWWRLRDSVTSCD